MTLALPDFAKNLQALRDGGMKPAEMARRTGKSDSDFSHWIKGKRLPVIEKQKVILEALGVGKPSSVSRHLEIFHADLRHTWGEADSEKRADLEFYIKKLYPHVFKKVLNDLRGNSKGEEVAA